MHSVMIGGRMVVEDRKLLTVDLAKLAAQAEESRVRREKITAPAKKLYDRLEKVVGTLLPRPRQGAAAHPPLRREPSPPLGRESAARWQKAARPSAGAFTPVPRWDFRN